QGGAGADRSRISARRGLTDHSSECQPPLGLSGVGFGAVDTAAMVRAVAAALMLGATAVLAQTPSTSASDAAPWDVSDVPHGVVHRHLYKSSIANDSRDLYVYT